MLVPVVARFENDSVEVAVRQQARTSDLSAVVDRLSIDHGQVRACGHEPFQIDQAAAAIGEECMFHELTAAVSGGSNGLTTRVYPARDAAGIALDSPDV